MKLERGIPIRYELFIIKTIEMCKNFPDHKQFTPVNQQLDL